jgi:N6-L-threonylcarbamoyladenine synthase
MKILSIETSCDETAVSLVEASGDLKSPAFSVLGNALFSQANLHKEFGGVYPNLAKREHAKNLPAILHKVLTDTNNLSPLNPAGFEKKSKENIWEKVKEITKREEALYDGLKTLLENVKRPDIDVIAVTSGPGLEPALWVGISCAKALAELWDIPVIGVNHMEGHIASILIDTNNLEEIEFPAIALLISGGHTEIVLVSSWGGYKILGQTLDDAAGEAFDKTARMLGLSYPGGPEISRLAKKARDENITREAKFTRPMINSGNLNFSFSGLKTAVLYYIRDLTAGGVIELDSGKKADIAREFEDAVIDVLLSKTKGAIDNNNVKTLIIAGGVIANRKIAEEFKNFEKIYKNLEVRVPSLALSTDNSLMIACSAYINLLLFPEIINKKSEIIASGNLRIDKKIEIN